MNSGSDAEDPGLEQAGCIKRVREERRGVDSGLRGLMRPVRRSRHRHPRPIAHKTSIFPSKIRNIRWRQG